MEQTDGWNDLLPVIKYGFDYDDDDEHGNRGYGWPMNAATRSDLLTTFVCLSVRPSVATVQSPANTRMRSVHAVFPSSSIRPPHGGANVTR